MKKLLLIIASFLVIGTTFAQKIKLQKLMFGVVVPFSGTMTLTTPLKPFTLGYNLLPNVVFITNRSYHNFLYGTGNNVIKTVQGWRPKKDLGVYLALQKNLGSNNGYAGIGVEKFIPIVENVTFFLFTEIGKNIGIIKSGVFVIGFHGNIQSLIWKK